MKVFNMSAYRIAFRSTETYRPLRRCFIAGSLLVTLAIISFDKFDTVSFAQGKSGNGAGQSDGSVTLRAGEATGLFGDEHEGLHSTIVLHRGLVGVRKSECSEALVVVEFRDGNMKATVLSGKINDGDVVTKEGINLSFGRTSCKIEITVRDAAIDREERRPAAAAGRRARLPFDLFAPGRAPTRSR